MIKEIRPEQAFEKLEAQDDAVLIDVRSTMEYEYVGHPLGAIHVPIKEPPDWETDAEFVSHVRQALKQHYPETPSVEALSLFMLCRSGKRSELGAELLLKDGFSTVYNVLEGFEGDKDDQGHRNTVNGWRYHKLPWEQS